MGLGSLDESMIILLSPELMNENRLKVISKEMQPVTTAAYFEAKMSDDRRGANAPLGGLDGAEVDVQPVLPGGLRRIEQLCRCRREGENVDVAAHIAKYEPSTVAVLGVGIVLHAGHNVAQANHSIA